MLAEPLTYNDDVARETAPIYEKLKSQFKQEHWETLAPYIYEINRLKKEKNAVLLAHNYMTPDVFYGVGDVTGDSLKLARVAAESDADIIVQCGVNFMAETAKILCPDKKVIIPDPQAGCSLADSIDPADLRAFKAKHPGVPVITYVNTSAAVKAESDVCCTSSNALKIVEALGKEGYDTVIMTPDQYLAKNTAAETNVKIIFWEGACEVHERFTAEDVRLVRAEHGDVVVLAHPECPPEVMAEADYAGSTLQMDHYIKEHQPKKAVLYTECSMSDNLAANNPNVEFIGTCQMCPHMKRITLPKILNALKTEGPCVEIDANIIDAARKPIERMLALS